MGKCSVVGNVKILTNQKWVMSNDFADVMHLRSASTVHNNIAINLKWCRHLTSWRC